MTRRGRIAVWSASIVALLVLAAGGAGGWVYQRLDGNINASDIDDKLGGGHLVNLSPGAKNILMVGSDSRDGANGKHGKDLTTMQSDTLMVLRIAANRKWAAVVSLLRDSWVQIPACDRGDGTQSAPHPFKINAAYAIGSAGGDARSAAACTIKTIEHNTGLRIDHFITLDFQGFKGMVNALGGIEICPKQAIHDKKARLDLEAGCQTVRDEHALGYVRTRYSVGDGSDIGRIGRRQEFMQALATRAQEKLTSPGDVYAFLDAATKSITIDTGLAGIPPLYGLASKLQDIPKDRLAFLTVPNYPREVDIPTDKANISWQYPQAHTLFDALAKDQEITKEQLTSAPSVTAGSIPAPQRVAGTTLAHPSGLEIHAQALASRLKWPVGPDLDDRAAPRVITLTVGPDYTGLLG
ncbi:Putative transcriptional regulator YwtF [Streptomyces sp. ADI95-16]|uniref:LCP family protein n=1 Tax=Streptomyces sp. ADI95-16 TaxID=1522758 RepID=UPI000F3A80E7|nr:LCP family protein [Streptomyces sp. ADI95-16]AYV26420.1 Putative transcriptional regulator YwtF [Streptomyces sp. ADI95-16]